MAQIIKSNGQVIETAPKNGTDFQLEELKSIVGGYIEIVNLRDGRLICLNEEGKLYNLPYNYKATDILRAHSAQMISLWVTFWYARKMRYNNQLNNQTI